MKLSAQPALAAASLLLFSLSTHAALVAVDIDLANPGLEGVYDDVLDVTWLADANIAASNTFGVSGISTFNASMSWSTAELFVNAMNTVDGGAGYLGVTTWRQPTATPVNGTNFVFGTATYDGSTDQSYNLTAPFSPLYNPTPGLGTLGFTGSELAYHYYNNFEARPEASGTGTTRLRYHLNENGIHRAPDPNNYRALFQNIQTESVSSTYWTGVAVGNEAIRFRTFWGSQGLEDKDRFLNVWAVAPGNVAGSVVPVPAAAWLFGSALTGLLMLRRKIS